MDVDVDIASTFSSNGIGTPYQSTKPIQNAIQFKPTP
jgi:hypothetical protein